MNRPPLGSGLIISGHIGSNMIFQYHKFKISISHRFEKNLNFINIKENLFFLELFEAIALNFRFAPGNDHTFWGQKLKTLSVQNIL